MKVLFVAAEGVPFVKTGGLGDVIGSLPQALQEKGLEVGVMMPLYGDISSYYKEAMTLVSEFTVPLAWRSQYCGLKSLSREGISYYFVDNEYYFKRDGIYGFYDEAERYAFFCRAVLESLPHLGFKPQILHCHDWHTGVLSLFLRAFYKDHPFYRDLRTVFTIHNLHYQGIFPREILGDILGLGEEYLKDDRLEFYHNINFMKAGIVFSDVITTVSRTYAEEIKTPLGGENLDALLRKRERRLFGILNGIDTKKYNPLTDPALFVPYRCSLTKKVQNKLKLQELLGLPVKGEVPLLALVSRLVAQKGLDLLVQIMEELLARDLQMVILGRGEETYENFFLQMAQRYSRQLAARIMFDETLARRIYAGSDIFLMPSLSEPCGLGQLLALRYGSIPVVRETGGLKDTVTAYNEYTGTGNGFTFTHFNARDFLYTIDRALNFYGQKDVWSRLVNNACKGNFSWQRSAREYLDLYRKLLSGFFTHDA
ncbi:MAG: hypothetical protein JG781_1974 [Peptococcaceae bacterium]|nr:hypothetical protein [Peptococcaceae bacterium]